ncbi:MAG: twin-arginine translocase subunit TatC [Planctomycetota bacterium]|jgi:sec-independent protein translocase protein TatC
MGKKTREQYDEDLFKDTTMTFGEHLEELRSCLFRALLGLVVGFLAGLYWSDSVVWAIKKPLTDALTAYQQRESEENIKAKWEELLAAGYPLPKDPERAKEFIKNYVAGKKPKKFEEVYVNPEEFLLLLKQADPEQFQNVSPPASGSKTRESSNKLVRVFLWHEIKEDVQVSSLSAHEPFGIFIKAAFLVGLIIASPWVFWQIWSFVAAGLYPHEKRYVRVFGPFSLALFLAGAALAFFFVFEPVLKFLFYFNEKLGIAQEIRISEWLGFVLILPLGFGVAFQLPLVMLFLERIGIFDVHAYLSRLRIAILLIFVLAMFLTPADPYSMLLMAIPLTVLYFGGILLCKYMPRRRSPVDELED